MPAHTAAAVTDPAPAAAPAAAITVHPLSPERWPDLEAVFNAKGCSEARGCWCMFYRHSGPHAALAPGQSRPQRHRDELLALAQQEPPPGLIGYRGDTPVGWVSLGPRQDFARLARSPVMRPVQPPLPGQAVWSIVCFVVPSAWRGQGVAKALLRGAVAWAAQRGATLLEAYPVDLAQTPQAESLWFGTASMFGAAGFTEVARRRPGRPVLRLQLAEPTRPGAQVPR